MKMYTACMFCLLNKQERELRDFPDEDKKIEYMKELMRLVGNCTEEACAPWLASQVSGIHEKYFGKTQGYGALKKKFNQLVLDMEDRLEQRIRAHEDPLRAALVFARVGNYIDFSAVDEVDQKEFLGLFDRENDVIDEREYQSFVGEMEDAQEMVYLLDNCGEIVLDKLVIRILKERFPGVRITAVVRGGEVVNDATMDDAEMTGLTGETEVLGNGDDVAGTILNRVCPQVRERIDKAEVILAKGQGNFESLHGCGKNVYYLFLCKCDLFMKKFGANRFQGMFLNEGRVPEGAA